MGTFLYF